MSSGKRKVAVDDFAKYSYVKIVGVSGDFRYGYISNIMEQGDQFEICLHEEGDSAIGYEEEFAKIHGMDVEDWNKNLTDAEKQLIPFLADNMTNQEIANELRLSPVTIRAHKRSLRAKLQLDDIQLTVFCQGLNKHLQEGSNERTDLATSHPE